MSQQHENIAVRSYFLQFYAPYTRFLNQLQLQRKKPGLNKYRETLIASLPTLAVVINKFTLGDNAKGKKALFFDGTLVPSSAMMTAWNHLKYNGKLTLFLKSLGIPEAVVDADPSVAIMKDKVEKEFDLFGSGFKALARFEYRSEAGRKFNKIIGGKVPTNADVVAILAKYPTIKKFFDDFHSTKFSAAYTVGATKPVYGEWVKTVADPTKTTMNDLFDAIREHTKLLSGCWNVNYGGVVTTGDGSVSANTWVPGCLVEKMTCNKAGITEYGCFPPHLRKCGKTGDVMCYKCPSVGCTCGSGAEYSQNCNISKTEIPPTSAIARCKASFWLGAQDFMNVSFKDAVEALGATDEPEDEPGDDVPVDEGEDEEPGFFTTTWYIWVIGFSIILFMLLRK